MPMNSTNPGLLGGIGVDGKIQELTKRYGGDDLSVGLLPSPPGFFEYPQGTIRSAPTDRFSGLISGPLDTSMDSGLPSMKSDNQIAREAADAALGLGPENMAGGGGGRGAGLFRGLMATIGKAKGKGITAFHGSPYDFDKFSMGKLSTGEGGQAFGHGLYFAEKEAVARTYQDTLAPSKLASQAEILPEYFKPGNIIPSYGGQDKVLKFKADPNGFNWVAHVVEVDKAGNSIPGARIRVHATPPTQKEVESVLGRKMGKMYEVEIKADRKNFLDYDKPIKDQPKALRDAYREAFGNKVPMKDREFLELFVSSDYAKSFPDASDVRQATRVLESGFPGIGEWAAKQRDLGVKSSAWNMVGPGTGRGVYRELTEKFGSEAAASNYLTSKGVPGIKFFDQGSRGGAGKSRNFVVFDDKTIDIIKKYGIAGLLAGGAGLGLLGGNSEATQ
jgi:hypothetical protein